MFNITSQIFISELFGLEEKSVIAHNTTSEYRVFFVFPIAKS